MAAQLRGLASAYVDGPPQGGQADGMRATARIVGIAWMVGCAILWIWLGFAQPLGRIDSVYIPYGILTLLSDSQFGLTMIAILLGGIGYIIWRWGAGLPIGRQ